MSELQSLKQRFGIIGNSAAYNAALQIAVRVAPTNLSVLITGESGVGKEVFSKIIHALSPRKHNKLIAVNCGAIPGGTIDSELFGHEKGAFTGANDKRKGYFETVNQGTIFLDEIGEMPVGTQARLLRILESGEYLKVGSSEVQKTDVRVIAATNKDLMQDIVNKKFREDLYYRLGTVPIKVPPLRERKEDIHLLFRKFASDFNNKYRTNPIRLTDEAVDVLVSYEWPGNVRELKNIAEQVSILSTDAEVTKEQLIAFIPNANTTRLPSLVTEFAAEQEGAQNFSERELLYKMLFDMKSDINELKSVLGGIIRNGNQLDKDNTKNWLEDNTSTNGNASYIPEITYPSETTKEERPIILNDIDEHTEIEETLNIADMEKDLIQKALVKHKGKRKDAAAELGISERTLYRKITLYNISE